MKLMEKLGAVASVSLLILLIGFMVFACFALIWDAWHIGDPPTEAEIRWDALNNEHDRNMHDPTRPPDSIANEARLKMLLLEQEEEQR
jgi:hypothetical protein